MSFPAKVLTAGWIIIIIAAIISFLSSPVKTTQQASVGTSESKPPDLLRRLFSRELETRLLDSGFDVHVAVIQEDDSKLVIYGKPVNRVFAHQFMRQPEMRKALKKANFTEVQFFDSMTFPSFSEHYSVQ